MFLGICAGPKGKYIIVTSYIRENKFVDSMCIAFFYLLTIKGRDLKLIDKYSVSVPSHESKEFATKSNLTSSQLLPYLSASRPAFPPSIEQMEN